MKEISAKENPALRNIVKAMRRGALLLEKKKTSDANKPYRVYAPQFVLQSLKEEKKEKKESAPKGIEISEHITTDINAYSPIYTNSPDEKKGLRMTYSLIPRNPRKGEMVFAYADIKWDENKNDFIYNVVEPRISQWEREVIEETKRALEERLDVDFYKIGEVKAKELLRQEVFDILSEYKGIEEQRKAVLLYYIERDIIGLGKIEPLMNDPNIEDISCDGVNIPVYVYHRNPKIGSVKTNIIFTDSDELNTFVSRMAQKCRKTINIAEPLLDATLPDGSRIQATLGTDIARKGSNFTIRKFTDAPLTPTHMLDFGTLDSTELAYLWLAIENGQSILISGGTATGKTSLLNALSLFIKPNLKIVSIEDTAELRLPHPHWIPEVARTPLSEGRKRGEVTLFDLLKSSLRQRPDYIIMGEVRGKETFVLFQQMATGHPSIATIHAASIDQLVDRLTTPPISLPPTLLENINIIIFLVMSRLGGNYVRRANKIAEVLGIENNRPVTRDVFAWNPARDRFDVTGTSVVLKNISLRLGVTDNEIKAELIRRRAVLEWMRYEGIRDYRHFARIVSSYYLNPKAVIDMIVSKYGNLHML